MKVVVIPEPVLQPDITKEDMDLKWNLLKELPEVDELVIKHFDGYPSNEELHPVIADADAAIGVWVNGSNINEEFLSKHPNLKYVATLGHDVGDLVLKEMADIFSGLCEKQGFVCRYGGDEYIIVFFTADKERLKETAKQIYQKIDQADGFEKAISEKLKKQISIRKEQRISCSIGIVLAEDIHGEEEINQMIKRADDLLYSIKTTKKGTYRI